ncbi:serine/threonine protein phosphatase [Psychrobacter frigidicola]|uniref:Serine/threonine protein phosphatase n=2 Tax=Psychrobacter frigidicola TaxID=45611 RepID=A0A5C7A7E0_9GAMM|nr:sulfur transferase domain-containing protein [Psychrobacter frigidicola]TXD98635.1 serine/threonine protein phosphatase [Psychrobacter frigidicola]
MTKDTKLATETATQFTAEQVDVEQIDSDNGIDLAAILKPYHRPDDNNIVSGALDEGKVAALALAGVEVVINLQPDSELDFDEATAVKQAGMQYEQLPIAGADDLKQINMLAFDSLLRQYHGKKIAMHCKSGSRVGAAMALRAGWLRGRKMETAMERGHRYGLTEMFEQEVHNRLLVPR